MSPEIDDDDDDEYDVPEPVEYVPYSVPRPSSINNEKRRAILRRAGLTEWNSAMDMDGNDASGVLGGAGGVAVGDNAQRDNLAWFLDGLAERFLGRKVTFLTELKKSHLKEENTVAFTIVAPSFMQGPGNFEIMKVAGVETIEGASSEDSRGERMEASYSEFDHRKILTYGTWPTVLNGIPVCIEFSSGPGTVEFTFFYGRSKELDILPTLMVLKNNIDNLLWYKGKTLSLMGSGLKVIKTPPTTLSDIVLDTKLLTDIYNNTIYYLKNMESIQKAGLYARRGVLMSGPPGNGKTLTCRAIANEAPTGTTTLWVTGASISHTSHISSLFNIARALAPVVVIFEDIDAIGRSRDFDGGSTSPLLGEMLSQMDGLGETTGIVFLATTNYPDVVDSALKDRPRRFDRHYKIPLPDIDGRQELLFRGLPTGLGITKLDLRPLAGRLEKASAALIGELVHTARITAIRLEEPLAMKHLFAAADEVAKYDQTAPMTMI